MFVLRAAPSTKGLGPLLVLFVALATQVININNQQNGSCLFYTSRGSGPFSFQSLLSPHFSPTHFFGVGFFGVLFLHTPLPPSPINITGSRKKASGLNQKPQWLFVVSSFNKLCLDDLPNGALFPESCWK